MRALMIAVLFIMMLPKPMVAQSNGHQVMPTARKHCVCLKHGPRGGCLRWQCRRQYERPRPE